MKQHFLVQSLQTHLGFNANFDDAAHDGEDVADDQKDVPAIDELQAVRQAHFTTQDVPEVLHVLLTSTQMQFDGKEGNHQLQINSSSVELIKVYLIVS